MSGSQDLGCDEAEWQSLYVPQLKLSLPSHVDSENRRWQATTTDEQTAEGERPDACARWNVACIIAMSGVSLAKPKPWPIAR